ncbi:MAG TPA: bacillithiol system redox-active protein YtxJ [Phaeodactylibacter sp.]|nr:bacillithiol system redox-active protein YtxJ [Phaeodactylibacter sp.]
MAGLEELLAASKEQLCMIFKHSTRCPLSAMAKERLESKWSFDESQWRPYYLDLIRFRSLSNAIAERFGVRHESPQVLVISDGVCIYDSSHLAISVPALEEALHGGLRP